MPWRHQADQLLADDIDLDSEFGEHRESHAAMKPKEPSVYPNKSEELETSPPGPVPPLPDAGQLPAVRIHSCNPKS